MLNTTTQAHVDSAIDLFLGLAESAYSEYQSKPFESPEYWNARDLYVSLSNTAAQLMGDKTANPFI
jgi:hypothetical protein